MPKPRIVLFRHAPVDFDSRIKRIATTLHRGGFEPIIISTEPAGGESGEFLLGGHTRVIRVPLQAWPTEQAPKPNPNAGRASRLRRQRDVYAGRVRGLDVASAKSVAKWAITTAKLCVVGSLTVKDRLVTRGKAVRAKLRRSDDPFEGLDMPRNLPVAHNLVYTLKDLLVELEPDVLHAHNPLVLPVAWAAARELRENGRFVKLSYDVREDFAGLPAKEIGNPAAHEALLGTERAFMPLADYVMTVTESHAHLLQDKYKLPVLPETVVNLSVFQPMVGDVTVREAAGLGDGVPLLVYAGVMSWARGIETLIESMAHLDEKIHLAIVTMPLPHPMQTKLDPLAEELGVRDRIHYLDPVNQANLSYYLHGADVAVHPLPGGSPNHDRTLPNKLFEYLHAELPLVSSDAKTMAQFVVDNGMGNVFTTGDPVDLAEKATAQLAHPVPQAHLHELAEKYSWQSNEKMLIASFGRLTDFVGEEPSGPFGSTEVDPVA
ncbi:Glycosyltransferase involved in cell wall bisynthesis [Tessaracoccus bendigoensis DSM 12906]|uniref:Glycosyltransferase involved in cell wall bisynthesis n=1 Tax=Tessaracoccus bendigoensis DSM 12906 TaxID=1123357 RepID=A0A1M6DHV8_9ACTN|nr:glycosyltransferase [Tessaracoccus bendigoensis]SHI72693.1 Glycosyltransferase involved in cell wall bisynthesis [Tessaracoccus bendigoensis DSM 12906]